MTERQKLSLADIKLKLREKWGTRIKLRDKTFVDMYTKALFLDGEHQFWNTPYRVLHGHLYRGRKVSQRQVPISIAQARIDSSRGKNKIRIIEKSYKGISQKAEFEYVETGERWVTHVKRVIRGDGPPSEKHTKLSQIRLLTHEEVQRRIDTKHGNQQIKMIGKYVNSHTATKFINLVDKSTWYAKPYTVMYGSGSPSQRIKKAARTLSSYPAIKHWKTDELCGVRSSYEYACICWLNKNQIDFDWQVPIKTPFLTRTGKVSVYWIDLFLKSGQFANTWIEIKGRWRNGDNQHKWEWFHEKFSNSALWTLEKLQELNIMQGCNIHPSLLDNVKNREIQDR